MGEQDDGALLPPPAPRDDVAPFPGLAEQRDGEALLRRRQAQLVEARHEPCRGDLRGLGPRQAVLEGIREQPRVVERGGGIEARPVGDDDHARRARDGGLQEEDGHRDRGYEQQ